VFSPIQLHWHVLQFLLAKLVQPSPGNLREIFESVVKSQPFLSRRAELFKDDFDFAPLENRMWRSSQFMLMGLEAKDPKALWEGAGVRPATDFATMNGVQEEAGDFVLFYNNTAREEERGGRAGQPEMEACHRMTPSEFGGLGACCLVMRMLPN
jgi:hypothetical protein